MVEAMLDLVKDFHLLVSLKVFNTEQMDQAVFAFRRCEDALLRHTGIDRHPGLTWAVGRRGGEGVTRGQSYRRATGRSGRSAALPAAEPERQVSRRNEAMKWLVAHGRPTE